MILNKREATRSPCGSEDRMSTGSSQDRKIVKTLHVAPMMDVSTREFRALIRIMSKRTVLWTEMVVDSTIVHTNDLDFHLEFDRDISHPITCQIGGCKQERIREATEKVLQYGYDEINLNMGCPSHRVEGERKFGALLMKQITVAEQAVEAMQKASSEYSEKTSLRTPISVKCRVGVDEYDTLDDLVDLIRRLYQKGCRRFYLHARKAVLGGLLSPSQNRDIPPLNYPRVYAICRLFPDCDFYINGGIKNLADAKAVCYGRGVQESSLEKHGSHGNIPCESCGFENGSCVAPPQDNAPINLKGCLLGRAAMENPVVFWDVDRYFYGEVKNPCQNRREILYRYCEYLEKVYPRRCCDDNPTVTTRITGSTSFHCVYDYCHKCAALFTQEQNGRSTIAPVDFSKDFGKKITSHVLNRCVKPINNIFFGLPKSAIFRQCLHEVSRNDSVYGNCGPSALIRRALLSVPKSFLDEPLVSAEYSQDRILHTKRGKTKLSPVRSSKLVSCAVALLLLSLSCIARIEGSADTNVSSPDYQILEGEDNATEGAAFRDIEQESPEERSSTIGLHGSGTVESNFAMKETSVFESDEVPVVMSLVDEKIQQFEEPLEEDAGPIAAAGECVLDPLDSRKETTHDHFGDLPINVQTLNTEHSLEVESSGSADTDTLALEVISEQIDPLEQEELPHIDEEAFTHQFPNVESDVSGGVNEASTLKNLDGLEAESHILDGAARPDGAELELEDADASQDESSHEVRVQPEMSMNDAKTTNEDSVMDLDEDDASKGDSTRVPPSSLVEDVASGQKPSDFDHSIEAGEPIGEELLEPVTSSVNDFKNHSDDGTAPKGSLASFFESANSVSSSKSFEDQLEQQQTLTSHSEVLQVKNNINSFGQLQYKGEPWGYYRQTRRLPDFDLLHLLFQDLSTPGKFKLENPSEMFEKLEKMEKDPLFDDSQTSDLSEKPSDSNLQWRAASKGEDNTQDVNLHLNSDLASDANFDFVEGLDDLGKFFEGIDPPDELDIGASGLSIQEVLVGKGREILVKKVVQLTYAVKIAWNRLTRIVNKITTRKDTGREENDGDGNPRKKWLDELAVKAWNLLKAGAERIVDLVDRVVDRFDGDEDDDASNVDFSSPLFAQDDQREF